IKPSPPRRYGRGSVPLEIDLGPVAGRQDRRFLRATGGYDIAQRVDQDLGCEDHSLPHVERRGSVVEAYGEERHGTLPAARNHELRQLVEPHRRAHVSREGPPRPTDQPPGGQRAERAWGDVSS